MSNFDTISAITDNLQSILKALGLNFTLESIDDLNALPASVLPHGRIFYESEAFEYVHNQKPEYATASFNIVVVLSFIDSRDTIRQQQSWVHRIREALTVNALNIGTLATSKLVSLASLDSVECGVSEGKAFASCKVSIRYREV